MEVEMWPRVVFPGRPLRVERRGCLSQGERSAGAVPGSLLFGARSDSFVLCRRRVSRSVVQRAGPASDWRQRMGSKRCEYTVRNRDLAASRLLAGDRSGGGVVGGVGGEVGLVGMCSGRGGVGSGGRVDWDGHGVSWRACGRRVGRCHSHLLQASSTRLRPRGRRRSRLRGKSPSRS